MLSRNGVVFNIKGNKYRLIAIINFDYGQAFHIMLIKPHS